MDNIGTIILATGALGTAAFGIVEALKALKWLAEAGFPSILTILGPIMETLVAAYGPDAERLLRAQYRGDQKELTRVIRQGVRIGLTEKNATQVAQFLGIVDAAKLKEAARAVEAGQELPIELRNVLGRFELAVDARIDAALTLALDRYVRAVKWAASLVALILALSVGIYLNRIFEGLIVGLAAVPLAPIAKDLVSALKAASDAIRART